ncbi:putative L-type lectin-domain containing receptor kinase S.7 [Senna tora]|uniref:non-specific serine/threonine protein kinase n=1 Tax=Senna tora TaxID=362788 RepID=A0A834T5U0_9FABA|nr:putative L-type lectin-domain containing receptor kinase S.7 [Senna tora]
MRPRTSIVIIFFLLAIFGFLNPIPTLLAASLPVDLEFPSFTLRNFTLLGDSCLKNGVVGLTRSTAVPSSSAGAIIYNQPIPLFDLSSNTSSSFSTRFSFSIERANPSSYGDGLAFFLSPTSDTLGSAGGCLGLVNASRLTRNKFVAVEFDTRLDPSLNDPNENHVGLDVDSTISIKTGDAILEGIDLKSGSLITAWIEYRSDKRNLNVWLSYSSFKKPEKPILSVDVDLSDHLKEEMYLGFSGSTEGSTELHQIMNWRFQSFGFVPARPSSMNPHNVSDSSVTSTTVSVGIPKRDSRKKHDKRIQLGISIAGPAFFCAVLSVLGYITVRRWRGIRKQRSFKTEFVACPREFNYKELKSATKGFHPSRVVGNGSFGTVYKAFFISSGTIAAVKKSRHSHEGETEFLAELSIIAGLRHKNLVQLQGWCVEKGELLLVYDFMPNGSLDKILYQESERSNLLNWSHRLNIAIGVASVVGYLHQECEQRVIHRDIKTANILLDANFNPRLGDFGLAKLMDHDKSPVSTLTAGTMGYLAPEYLQYGKATEKTDVFSYGVVVLEVACGRRPIEREGQKMVNLVDWVWGLHSEGRIIEAADKRLNGEFEEEGMRKLLLLGLSCANPDSAERPSMRRVLQILNNEASALAVPKVKPSLTFSYGLPLTIDEIVSDAEDFHTSQQSLCEIKIN